MAQAAVGMACCRHPVAGKGKHCVIVIKARCTTGAGRQQFQNAPCANAHIKVVIDEVCRAERLQPCFHHCLIDMQGADIMPARRILVEIGLGVLGAARTDLCKAIGVSDADRIIGVAGVHQNASKSRRFTSIGKAIEYPIPFPEADQKASLCQDFEMPGNGGLRHAKDVRDLRDGQFARRAKRQHSKARAFGGGAQHYDKFIQHKPNLYADCVI
jgi:hypothetical protein